MANLKCVLIIIILCIGYYLPTFSQDSTFIKVHFLYGSKPAKGFSATEKKWFGGKLGGHAGVEIAPQQILNILPKGKFHYLPNKNNKHSNYLLHTENQFYGILGGSADSAKKLIITIPLANWQKQKLDSIAKQYCTKAPYDYAFAGMRCGAATYEVLAQLGILPTYSKAGTCLRIWYPKMLRKKVLLLAKKYNWQMQSYKGCTARLWETD